MNMTQHIRLKLILGKFPVRHISVDRIMTIRLPSLGIMQVPLPPSADVREGDLLTIYTEILTHAKP
jgi:hypothetical protein